MTPVAGELWDRVAHDATSTWRVVGPTFDRWGKLTYDCECVVSGGAYPVGWKTTWYIASADMWKRVGETEKASAVLQAIFDNPPKIVLDGRGRRGATYDRWKANCINLFEKELSHGGPALDKQKTITACAEQARLLVP